MADKMFTNQTGAYGLAISGDTAAAFTGSFQVAESTSGATTILRGQPVKFSGTLGDQKVAASTAAADLTIGIALQDVTVPDSDSTSYQGPKVVEVCLYGPCEARVSGVTVAAGAAVSAGTSGTVSTVGAAGTRTVGWALESTAGSLNDFKTIFVNPGVV